VFGETDVASVYRGSPRAATFAALLNRVFTRMA